LRTHVAKMQGQFIRLRHVRIHRQIPQCTRRGDRHNLSAGGQPRASGVDVCARVWRTAPPFTSMCLMSICETGVPFPRVRVDPSWMTTGTAKVFAFAVNCSFQLLPSPTLPM